MQRGAAYGRWPLIAAAVTPDQSQLGWAITDDQHIIWSTVQGQPRPTDLRVALGGGLLPSDQNRKVGHVR